MLPLFLLPLALDRNDFKFASALSAIPLLRKLPLGAIPPLHLQRGRVGGVDAEGAESEGWKRGGGVGGGE